VERARDSGRAGGYNGQLLEKDVLKELRARFGQGYPYTPSRLGSYITCPFIFLIEKVWEIEGRESREIGMSRTDRGKIVHRILNLFYRQFKEEFSWDIIEAELASLQEMTDSVMQSYFQADYLGPPALFEIEAEALRRELVSFVEKDIEISRELKAMPILLEYSIHVEDSPVHVETPAGTVPIGGRVDRIDALQSPEGGCIVMDYKTGYSPSIREIMEGKSLQVPLYIIALEKSGFNILLGYYYHIKDGKKMAMMGPGKDLFSRKGSSAGADWESIRGAVIGKIGEVYASITGGDFRSNPTDCPDYCRLKGICRLEPHRRKSRGWRRRSSLIP
jgi:ATP-dependent helicase/DNAse subunit B